MPQRHAALSGRPAILLVPWDRDFIDAVADHLLAVTGGDFRRVTVLFPLRRAGRFLVDRLRDDARLKKPALLPDIARWTSGWPTSPDDLRPSVAPARTAGPGGTSFFHRPRPPRGPGQRGLARGHGLPDELHPVLPWGTRLAELCEELFRHGIAARNIDHAASEVLPQAAACFATSRPSTRPTAPASSTRRGHPGPVPVPGRGKRPGGHNTACRHAAFRLRLLHPLGQRGAPLWAPVPAGSLDILWHADALVATDPNRAHYSCRELVSWMRRFGAPVVLHGRTLPSRPAAGGAARGGTASIPCSRTATCRAPRSSWPKRPSVSTRATTCIPSSWPFPGTGRGPGHLRRGRGPADTGLLMPVLHHLPRGT